MMWFKFTLTIKRNSIFVSCAMLAYHILQFNENSTIVVCVIKTCRIIRPPYETCLLFQNLNSTAVLSVNRQDQI